MCKATFGFRHNVLSFNNHWGTYACHGSGLGGCADQAQGLVPYIHDHSGSAIRDQGCQKDVKKAVW